MHLMGLDVGSTGVKAVVFTPEGEIVGSAYREYPEVYPKPGWIELRPDDVWEATRTVIAEAGSEAGGVRSLTISALGEAFTPISEDGQFLHNTIVSPDTRATTQAQSWHGTLGAQEVFEITGMPLHPSFTLNKLMWMRDEMPHVHQRTWKYLLWPETIHLKLGLTPRIDHSLAGRTMAFDVRRHEWSAVMLEMARIPEEMLAQPIAPGEVVGELSADAAAEVGLEPGCLVVAGGHDQPMNALGAGVVREGMCVDGMGTVECITVAFDEPVLTEEMRTHNYGCYPHVVPGMYATIAYNYSAGSILRWWRDLFGDAARREAQERGVDVYDIILDDLPQAPSGLLWVPYFAGSGTPYLDPQAKGAIIGLTLDTDRKRLVKALIEGTCYELDLNVQALDEAGVAIDRLRATGGGSRSDVWLQLKADITGRPVVRLNVSESGCQAGAILGGVALGVWADVTEATQALVAEGQVFEPRPDAQEQYAPLREVYADTWPAVREIAHRL
ncbi:MAG: FGGY-family carbohydrate kinase [Armatimonadota bacterium]|nr:FGGY-family carbohydrate kinase [Armatimonadota bacterium]